MYPPTAKELMAARTPEEIVDLVFDDLDLYHEGRPEALREALELAAGGLAVDCPQAKVIWSICLAVEEVGDDETHILRRSLYHLAQSTR